MFQGHKVRSKDLYVISPIDKRAEPNVKLVMDWLDEIKIHCFEQIFTPLYILDVLWIYWMNATTIKSNPYIEWTVNLNFSGILFNLSYSYIKFNYKQIEVQYSLYLWRGFTEWLFIIGVYGVFREIFTKTYSWIPFLSQLAMPFYLTHQQVLVPIAAGASWVQGLGYVGKTKILLKP